MDPAPEEKTRLLLQPPGDPSTVATTMPESKPLEDEEPAKSESPSDECVAKVERPREEAHRGEMTFATNPKEPAKTLTEGEMKNAIEKLTVENSKLRIEYNNIAEKLSRAERIIEELRKQLPQTESPKQGDNKEIPSTSTQFDGMLEFCKEDIDQIMRHLITELKPSVAITLLPGLPAYLLFMCIRHTDCINDDDKALSLLTSFHNTLQDVVTRDDDFEYSVLWLSNAVRLLHIMMQYSGDTKYQQGNTPRQNDQCLKNFDLSDHIKHLNNMAIFLYDIVIELLKKRVKDLIVPALLENSTIIVYRPGHIIHNTTSNEKSLDRLLKHLSNSMKIMQQHSLDPVVIAQIFRQLFYYIGSSALNLLLTRDDLCNCRRGIDIQVNFNDLKKWAKNEKLEKGTDWLVPIDQAAKLLHAPKTKGDVDLVYQMCSQLTGTQIMTLLDMYTPVGQYDESVRSSFKKKMAKKLKKEGKSNDELLMDETFTFGASFPFNPSNIRLELIEVPKVLDLPMLRKV